MELLTPTEKFINFVYHSKHYLNCPKFIFNEWLDSFYRLYPDDKLHIISEFLTKCEYPEPIKTAKKFIEERDNITMVEFNELNVNSYIRNIPSHIAYRHKQISEWYQANIKESWRDGFFISKSQPTYPYYKESFC
jgi:hypothetical protein